MSGHKYINLLPFDTKESVELYKDEKTGKHMGFVQLVDMMPRFVPEGRTGDMALVQGARISYGSSNLKSVQADKGLVEYLVEHYHTSPLEMAEVKFMAKVPLFVFNQLVRHRTACITGDCELIFDNKRMTIFNFYSEWKTNDKLKNLKLKMCDEKTGKIRYTSVNDIWSSGLKDVYEIELEDNKKIKTSENHLFLTNNGWKTLKEATNLTKNKDKLEYNKTLSFSVNNDNVRKFVSLKNIKYIGKEMTYDLEVTGPYHNFICNGFVVHNSLNCVSRRYTEIPEESFFIPELRVQDKINHQGSNSAKVEQHVKNTYDELYQQASHLHKYYKDCVDKGIGKEVARGAMPQNIMTEFVWKIDLHNFLKMCRLRLHHTAQKEIRELAEAMYSLVKPRFPIACNAFEKFWLKSLSLSMEELDLIKKGKNKDGKYDTFKSKRRQKQFEDKLKLLGLEKN
jgi:thymidylate synthase ThyX